MTLSINNGQYGPGPNPGRGGSGRPNSRPSGPGAANGNGSGPFPPPPQSQQRQPPQPPALPPLSPALQRESRDRMRMCIPEMLRTYPFFGFLALRMPLIPDDARISIAADGRNIYYNPRWVSEHSFDDLKYALARVTMACALKHHTRRGDRDYSRWQMASRLVTRHFLKDSGLKPSPATPENPDSVDAGEGLNQSVEQVYELLRDLFPESPDSRSCPNPGPGQGQSQGPGRPQQGNGQGQGQQQGQPGQNPGPGQGQGQGQQPGPQGQGPSQGQGPNSGANGNSGGGNGSAPPQSSGQQPNGSGADGAGNQDPQSGDQDPANSGPPDPQGQPDQQPPPPPNSGPAPNQSPRPGEPSPPDADPHGQGEVMDRPPGSSADTEESDQKEEEQRWDQALHKAFQFAKAQGREPGRMAEFIAAMHESQVEWRELLRRFLYAHSKTDYSWSRPNLRYLSQGLYLPALDTPTLPPLVLSIDTSGSMSSAELAQIWSEIQQLTAELKPEAVHVLQCDTQVSAADEYLPGSLPEELHAKGRGGTLFTPAFNYVDENLDRPPACMIYCTDLYCNDYPDPPPDYPVLWLVTGQHKPTQDAPFGERIDLDFPELS